MSDAAPEAPSAGDDFSRLYDRLGRPFEVVPTLAALVGLTPNAMSQLLGVSVATSPEAELLVAGMHKTVRGLATSLQAHNQRCIGELRGPVVWSETMSARASSFGDRDLFICATPSRAYDIDENRVLVAALSAVQKAGRAATENVKGPLDDPTLRTARRVAGEAAHWLDHPSLSPITRTKVGARALRRTRSGKHRKQYQAALDLLDRVAEPLTAEQVGRWCDRRTRAQHHVLIGLVDRLEGGGRRKLPDFRAERGALLAGPIQYHHGRGLGDRRTVSGIVVGPLLLDVPLRTGTTDRDQAATELSQRSGGRPSMVIFDDDDLDRAVVRAVELAGADRAR